MFKVPATPNFLCYKLARRAFTYAVHMLRLSTNDDDSDDDVLLRFIILRFLG